MNKQKQKTDTPSHKRSEATAKRPLYIHLSLQDRMLFMKRLGMILHAGMPLMEGLRMIYEESRTRSASFVYRSLIADVSNGQSLSAGLQRFEQCWGDLCISIIKIGESSGTLRENLHYLADEMKHTQTLRRMIIGALVYPAIIIGATIGIVVMLTVYIFPKIVPTFMSVKATLPFSTRILIAISDVVSAWWMWILGGTVAAIIGVVFLMRVPRFHYWMDRILLHIPLLGSLFRFYNLAHICRTLALLLQSGVRITSAIDLVAVSTGNLVYREALIAAGRGLMRGQKISVQFTKKTRLFPSMFAQMISVGEATGTLSGTFSYLSDMYEEEVKELTKNLTTLLEPILMIGMGLIVGFIAISIITPIYSLTQNLTPH